LVKIYLNEREKRYLVESLEWAYSSMTDKEKDIYGNLYEKIYYPKNKGKKDIYISQSENKLIARVIGEMGIGKGHYKDESISVSLKSLNIFNKQMDKFLKKQRKKSGK